MIKYFFLLFIIISSNCVSAHCPALYNLEKICFLLDENVLYLYSQKGEHSGPYLDLKMGTLAKVKSNGKVIPFSKIARGVYRLETKEGIKAAELEIQSGKKTETLKILQ
jgi:hypothetical protein